MRELLRGGVASAIAGDRVCESEPALVCGGAVPTSGATTAARTDEVGPEAKANATVKPAR